MPRERVLAMILAGGMGLVVIPRRGRREFLWSMDER